jgi:serine/threonine protein kinase
MERKGAGWFIDSHNGNIKEEYHFIEKIASGGFGVVYLAEHRKTSKLSGLDTQRSNTPSRRSRRSASRTT